MNESQRKEDLDSLKETCEKQKGIIKFLYLILDEMPSNKVNEVLKEMEKEYGEPMPMQETIEYIQEEVLQESENTDDKNTNS